MDALWWNNGYVKWRECKSRSCERRFRQIILLSQIFRISRSVSQKYISSAFEMFAGNCCLEYLLVCFLKADFDELFSFCPFPRHGYIIISNQSQTFTVSMLSSGSSFTLINKPALATPFTSMPSPGTASSSPDVNTCVQSTSSPFTFTFTVTVTGSSHLEC